MPQAARYKGRRKGTRHMSIPRSGLVVPLPATRGGVLATLALAPGYLLAAPSALLAQTAAPSALLAQTAAPSALRRKTSRLRRCVVKRRAFGAPRAKLPRLRRSSRKLPRSAEGATFY